MRCLLSHGYVKGIVPKPFNDLSPLPPKTDIETRAILRKTISATRALAELKGIGDTIPNQSLLIDSLILQEAKASSEIENVFTTDDALLRAFSAKTSKTDPATKEVLRYREALWEGFKLLEKRGVLTSNLFISVVQRIKENQAGIRKIPGIVIVNETTGDTIFTPPEGESVIQEKLKSLEVFMNDIDEIDPLIKLALIHFK